MARPFSVGHLNVGDGLCLKCGCREPTFSRDELVKLLGEDAPMENIGLRFRCSRCGERPRNAWVTWAWNRSYEPD